MVNSDTLLNDGQWPAEEGEADVIQQVILEAHDVLQLLTPIDHEAAWPKPSCQRSAAAPAKGRLPEAHDASNGIGVGHAHQGATASMNEHPDVIETAEDAVVKVVFACVMEAPHCQRALGQNYRRNGVVIVADGKEKHNQQRTKIAAAYPDPQGSSLLEACWQRAR